MERLATLLEKTVRRFTLSREYQLGAHPTPLDLVRESIIDRRLVSRVIDQDLVFDRLTKRKVQKCIDLNIEKHMLHSRKLLSNLTQKTLQPAFFSDEKIFKVYKNSKTHITMWFMF